MGYGQDMKSITRKNFSFHLAAALLVIATTAVHADIPDQRSGTLSGMYKVTSSSDPIFPLQGDQEWFLDFGNGVASGKLSGSVAVSLRQNPSVKVRIMAWQFFPAQAALVMGNPYAEGSKNAVVKGSWKMAATSGGFIWRRGNAQVVLQHADPKDY